MAPMYGLPLQHTVDDVMATERCSIVDKGNEVWRKTIELAGWDIPDSKSPNHQVKHACWVQMSGTGSMAPNWI